MFFENVTRNVTGILMNKNAFKKESRYKVNSYKILQIIPAPVDMSAVYEDEGKKFKTPLACLALIQYEDGTRCVVGIDSADCLEVAEDNVNFIEYYRQNSWEEIKEEKNAKFNKSSNDK